MTHITRYHDFSAGHRLVDHESGCKHLHGHNYRIHFTCAAPELDALGRVVDFSVVKSHLCEWIEETWDHRMLIWAKDPLLERLEAIDPLGVTVVGFNPSAENMAQYLLKVVGPMQLQGTGVTLIRVTVEETRKCLATCELQSAL